MNIAQGYYTPSGLFICGLDTAGNLVIDRASYSKMSQKISELFPNIDSETVIDNFIDYWQSYVIGIKESKFTSPTTIWKYKKIWKKVGFII